MLHFLPAPLLALIAALLMAINAVFWVPVLLFFSLLKFLLPLRSLHLRIDPLLVQIAQTWISGNSTWMALTQNTTWDVQGVPELSPHKWYLVTCNHQSWVDILVLQKIFNRRIPLLRFFLKQQLIWVPVMGLAWWALDFPFMRRHSEAYLKAHPEMRGKDQAATRRACEKFARIPTSVMSFLEGTRFTPSKHGAQNSPYQHLLKPKAGGIALALNVMGEKFDAVLDVSIAYPQGRPWFPSFLAGRLQKVIVRVRQLPLPKHLVHADYATDPAARQAYQAWLQQLWAEKDAQLGQMLQMGRA